MGGVISPGGEGIGSCVGMGRGSGIGSGKLSGGGSNKRSKRKAAKIKLVKGTPEVTQGLAEEPSSPGMVSQLGAALASQATVFLLNLAKEKLTEYLQERSQKKHEG